MPQIELKPLPPAEAVRFFRYKGFVIGFDWRDVWQDEHARAFTIAKALRLDILRDIQPRRAETAQTRVVSAASSELKVGIA